MDACSSLGALFRRARLEKGLTQEEIGDAIGMTANGYGKLELGVNRFPTDLIGPLCRATGVSMLDAMAVMSCASDDDVQEFVPFSGMECSVGFTPEEWRMHVELCRFAGIPYPYSYDAYLISKAAIETRRRNLAHKETEE